MDLRSLYLWLATLISLIILISASAIDRPPPPPPPLTNTLNSTISLSSLLSPPTFYSTLDKRQDPPEKPEKPKKHWTGRYDRLNPGKHNCPLMDKACHMFFEANWRPHEPERVRYKHLCKEYVCAQTFGDCFQHDCTWKC